MSPARKRKRRRAVSLSGDASHLHKTLEVRERGASAIRHLSLLKTCIGTLLTDENFVTLLQAEAMLTMPACLLVCDKEK
jgi:hypothetical protein